MGIRLLRRRPRCQLQDCTRPRGYMVLWTGNATHALYVCAHCASFMLGKPPTIVNLDTGHVYNPQVAKIASTWLDRLEQRRP